MAKRLTIEYIKETTKELDRRYECLSDSYINSKIKLEKKEFM